MGTFPGQWQTSLVDAVPMPPQCVFLSFTSNPGSLSAMRFITAVDMTQPQFLEPVSRELWMRIWSRVSTSTYPQSSSFPPSSWPSSTHNHVVSAGGLKSVVQGPIQGKHYISSQFQFLFLSVWRLAPIVNSRVHIIQFQFGWMGSFPLSCGKFSSRIPVLSWAFLTPSLQEDRVSVRNSLCRFSILFINI